MASFSGIGVMSGSSLDGLDLCYVEFTGGSETDIWEYRIVKAITIPYDSEWVNKLRSAKDMSGENLMRLHIEYGHYIGEAVKDFIDHENIINLDFIASHGHTIFHQPSLGYTFQLGDGETTAVHLKQPFICNFRNKDVALGGQGAPLVPNGEKYLFSTVDICVNLGGIANIGLNGLQGYDVCPCNYVSNKLAKLQDSTLEYDPGGQLAQKGKVLNDVLGKLDSLSFYSQLPPKSLGTEWIENEVLPILNHNEYSIEDLLMTYSEHISNQLMQACKHARDSLILDHVSKQNQPMKVLITGGGAFNKNLMGLLQTKLKDVGFVFETVDNQTIEFKEALIFAFLGLRSLLNQENVMRSVTGSMSDSISGSIHRPARPSRTVSKIIRYLMERDTSRSKQHIHDRHQYYWPVSSSGE